MAVEDLLDLETELKPYLGILDTPSSDDTELGILITQVTDLVEVETRRRFVFRGPPSYVEFHSILEHRVRLWTRDKPITNIVKITEDANGDHTSATPLVRNSDYTVNPRSGEILRISGNLPMHWEIGVRSFRIEYDTMYPDTASLPPLLKLTAKKLCALIWREEKDKRQGVTSKSDSTGNKTFFEKRILTPEMKLLLRPFKQHGHKTWEEDLP